jgi:hypothetical protein
MERQFGRDFRHVRVHTDAPARQSADLINARAYTLDQHIVFANGAFRPGTSSGRWLLAHELAHTIQQSGGASPEPSLPASSPGPAREAAAGGSGREPRTHATPPVSIVQPVPTGGIVQRAEPATTITISAVVARCIIGAVVGALFDATIQAALHSIRERTWRFWRASLNYCSIILSAIIGCIAAPVSAYLLEPWIAARLGTRLGGMAGTLIGRILIFIAQRLGIGIPRAVVSTLAKLGCISPEQAAELGVAGPEEEVALAGRQSEALA